MSQALGLVETRGLVGAIEAADAMAKAANVKIIGRENVVPALITIKCIGDVAAVKAAVEAGAAAAQRVGQLISTHVIPQPDSQLEQFFPEIREIDSRVEVDSNPEKPAKQRKIREPLPHQTVEVETVRIIEESNSDLKEKSISVEEISKEKIDLENSDDTNATLKNEMVSNDVHHSVEKNPLEEEPETFVESVEESTPIVRIKNPRKNKKTASTPTTLFDEFAIDQNHLEKLKREALAELLLESDETISKEESIVESKSDLIDEDDHLIFEDKVDSTIEINENRELTGELESELENDQKDITSKINDINSLNVHHLRKLARQTPNFPIHGREISKANRNTLLALFNKLV
jgi:ethanolamine utilization protein EutM